MKKIYTGFFLAVFVVACSSPEKLLQRGDYDGLIDKSVKKLIKDPNSSEDAELLDKAYKLANERDLERIKYLTIENNPNSWDEILSRYSSLKYRQEKVRKVLPLKLRGRSVNYEYIDYDSQIVNAKRKAAEYFYDHGKALMANNNKESYRQANAELSRAATYSGGSFPDLDRLIEESRYKGISRVLISVINSTRIRLPEDFIDNLIAINTTGLNSEWVEYHFKPLDNETVFDYYLDVNLQIVDVSPERVTDSDRLVKKTVQDGFNYALDSRGNVMKDTAGNDIKIPKYKDLTCTVIERIQTKTVTLKGEVELISNNPKRAISKDPIMATTRFEHRSGRAIGDLEALDEETLKAVSVKPLPFPDDITMIYDTSEALKKSITDVIRARRMNIR
ncbi:MAG: hypothetical protein JXB00_12785 [Bacteroidales bacterium]|nr:hypothetical protein [Bacteroidales bacterium]